MERPARSPLLAAAVVAAAAPRCRYHVNYIGRALLPAFANSSTAIWTTARKNKFVSFPPLPYCPFGTLSSLGLSIFDSYASSTTLNPSHPHTTSQRLGPTTRNLIYELSSFYPFPTTGLHQPEDNRSINKHTTHLLLNRVPTVAGERQKSRHSFK